MLFQDGNSSIIETGARCSTIQDEHEWSFHPGNQGNRGANCAQVEGTGPDRHHHQVADFDHLFGGFILVRRCVNEKGFNSLTFQGKGLLAQLVNVHHGEGRFGGGALVPPIGQGPLRVNVHYRGTVPLGRFNGQVGA